MVTSPQVLPHAQEGLEGPPGYGRNRVDGDRRRRLYRGRLRVQVCGYGTPSMMKRHVHIDLPRTTAQFLLCSIIPAHLAVLEAHWTCTQQKAYVGLILHDG